MLNVVFDLFFIFGVGMFKVMGVVGVVIVMLILEIFFVGLYIMLFVKCKLVDFKDMFRFSSAAALGTFFVGGVGV